MSDFCFFINDSATTEIYTYSHTLSRHDALPILSRAVAVAASLTAHSSEARVVQRSAISSVDWWDAAEIVTKASSRRPSGGRAEEHTSELQSLMRISFAVFCLKKKININKYL